MCSVDFPLVVLGFSDECTDGFLSVLFVSRRLRFNCLENSFSTAQHRRGLVIIVLAKLGLSRQSWESQYLRYGGVFFLEKKINGFLHKPWQLIIVKVLESYQRKWKRKSAVLFNP